MHGFKRPARSGGWRLRFRAESDEPWAERIDRAAFDLERQSFDTCDAAERVALIFVLDAFEGGVPVEYAVYVDGALDHSHAAPKRVAAFN
jgi:hypothetical protein